MSNQDYDIIVGSLKKVLISWIAAFNCLVTIICKNYKYRNIRKYNNTGALHESWYSV